MENINEKSINFDKLSCIVLNWEQVKPKRFAVEMEFDRLNRLLLFAYKKNVSARILEYQDNAKVNEYLIKITKWLISPQKKAGLLIYGDTGNGKTTMMNAIIDAINALDASIRQDGHASLFWVNKTTSNMLSTLYLTSSEEFDKIKTAEMLFIDDLGDETITIKNYGNKISPIIDVLNYRYDRQLFTLITSNLTDEAFKERYGERIADRFEEMFDRLCFENESFR